MTPRHATPRHATPRRATPRHVISPPPELCLTFARLSPSAFPSLCDSEKEAAERKKQLKLIEAAFDGEFEAVQKTLAGWVEECGGAVLIGAKVDCLDAQGHTPLSEASCGGQRDVCALLLKHGADPNARNSQGRTPIWRAAFMDKRDCVELLLESGGDPRIPSDSQELPKMVTPSAELKERLAAWDPAETDRILAAREELQRGQWVPPPPDPKDMQVDRADA